MTFVVSRPGGRWELRRSRSTSKGPRSETLASFRVLTEDVVDLAVERGDRDLGPEAVREAARRAGAPIALEPVRDAAARLMHALSRGARLPEDWRQPLIALLSDGGARRDGDAAAIGDWADAGPERRGSALWDLLLLADAIPGSRRDDDLDFPGFSTGTR